MENNYYDMTPEVVQQKIAKAESTLMRNVYIWMTLALCITGLSALVTARSEALLNFVFGSQFGLWALLIGEIVLVIVLVARIERMSVGTATLMFILYSVVNGLTFSSIFFAYDFGTISTAFFVAAGTFAAMAIVGSFIQRDLSGIGRICIMALIGIIIASLVNLFLGNSMLDYIISWISVVVFTGLTAYDAQKIKGMMTGMTVNDTTQKFAILGALTLYLDFINLFLSLLRIFGRD